jgi:hypothetical protein
MIYFRSFPCSRQRLYYGITAIVLLSLVFGIIGFEFADEREFVIQDNPVVEGVPGSNVSIAINLANRLLEVYSDEKLFKKYRIAVGKSETPSPIGEWHVVWKDYNWGTGFGTRWMGLDVPWGVYGIHGTNKPWSIGQFASHGCIRMRNKDVEELFEWIPVGTPVKIEGRNVKIQRVLKYQTTGADVVVLQIKLKEMGYLHERADGIYGRATEEAVRKYQQDKGLEVTGVVNKAVVEMLGV